MLLLLPAILLPSFAVLSNGNPLKNQYPWCVLLYHSVDSKPSEVLCAGAVISHRTVLTSSRCLQLVSFRSVMVRAGSDDLEDSNAVWYEADDIVGHPNAQTLDFIHWKNDIGLIFITGFFGDNVQPLHTSVVPIDRAMQVELQGFGTIFPGYRDNRTKLIGRKLFARSYRDCVRESGKLYNYAVKLDPHQACTVDPNHETKKCVMNVGGPVTICGILVGIVSWGSACNDPGTVILFTDVSYFNDWIYETMKEYAYTQPDELVKWLES